MPSELFHQNIDLQEKVYPNIFEKGESNENNELEPSLFLAEFSKYSDEISEAALGDLGLKLQELVQQLDFDHPEVKCPTFFANNSDLNAETFECLHQLVKLYLLAQDNNLGIIKDQFTKITKGVVPNIKSCLEFLKNKNFVRLFKADFRNYYRKQKETRSIELQYKKTIGLWDRVAEPEAYARFGNYCDKEIDKIKKKIKVYEQLRMNALAIEMENSIKEFSEIYSDNYYGFQRVPMTIVAIILAKMHKCYLQNESQIMVPFDNFLGFNNIVTSIAFNPDGTGMVQRLSDYQYLPTAYPINALPISEKMQLAIDHLDAFPEAGGKAIFDHFVVVVPGVYCPDSDDPLIRGKGSTNLFVMKTNLDRSLIEEKYILPILLGEKDGKCYFICFWE